jgi:catechol 2,3-dioxygenase-like lactoylglutathione lyase family enzyme
VTGLGVGAIHHIRLTVTDIDRSLRFYRDVVGLTVLVTSPGDPADPAVRADPHALYGGAVLQVAPGTMLGLRPVAEAADRFGSERVGLDHLSFTVAAREDLDAAVRRLDEHGVPHGVVTPLSGFGIAILSFSDPDGIHLELTAPL